MSYYPSYKEQFKNLTNDQKKILEKIPHLEEIDGWLLLVEAIELFSLASHLASPKPIICEIGTWKGKSAYVFATAFLKKEGLLYCIDPFNGDGDIPSRKSYKEAIQKLDGSLRELFEMTMKKYHLLNKIRLLPMRSKDARPLFPQKRIDILFIDGNHEYESVKMDYDLWSPLIPSDGKIVLHDVGASHVDGPRRIMEKYIFNNSIWKDAHIVGEMGIATKT